MVKIQRSIASVQNSSPFYLMTKFFSDRSVMDPSWDEVGLGKATCWMGAGNGA